MTREERLRLLGPECVAEIHHMVAEVPPPTPQIVELIRQIFAPAVKQIADEKAAATAPARHRRRRTAA